MKKVFTIFLFLLVIIIVNAQTLNRPQTPTPPYPYDTLDINIINKIDGTRLYGTLTTPIAPQKSKASIILATGSGSQNRDEEIFQHKPFKVIADFLTKNGYTVLRLDDRTYTYPSPNSKATTDTFLSDIIAGIEYLRIVNPKSKIGILGHSEGGTIAIKAAATNQADFIITLAAPALQGDSILISQVKATSNLQDNDQAWKELYPIIRKRYDLIMSDLPSYMLKSMLYLDVISKIPAIMMTEQLKSQINAGIDAMTSEWYRAFLRYDPSEDIRKINVKWLALNGKKDVQVLSEENLNMIKYLNPNSDIINYENLNHLFQNSNSGAVSEYVLIDETISIDVLNDIVNWLDENITN